MTPSEDQVAVPSNYGDFTGPPAALTQFAVDKRLVLNLFFAMPPTKEKLVTPFSLIVDAIVVGTFFALLFFVLRSHVPSNDPQMITLWSALAASCLSGVFWLAVQMFRVVLRFQRASRR